MQKGNLVDWDKATFQLENMTTLNLSSREVCVPLRPGHVILPERKNLTSYRNWCERMRGHASVVRDQETQDFLIETLKDYYETCDDAGCEYFHIFGEV